MVWFNRSDGRETSIKCVACGENFCMEVASLDHHPSVCPKCGVECLLFSFPDFHLQIVPDQAPEPLGRTIRWMQENLDELDFVEVTVALQQIAENQPFDD